MIDELVAILDRATGMIAEAGEPDMLEEIRLEFLGQKRGILTDLKTQARSLEGAQKGARFKELSDLEARIDNAIETKRAELSDRKSVVPHFLDLTRPGLAMPSGGLHPTIQIMYDLNDAFEALNFSVYEGPEISTEEFEFDYMNFPPDHPARESMDTYWLADSVNKQNSERYCLRPHLTGASVRYMREHGAPCRFVYPGRVYRNESTDARHERAFFQYEALIVDKDIAFTSGQLMIDTILKTVFGKPVKTRMRAGFFPFVEPGFEIDMECQVCAGKGCSVCKHVGWLEVMPGGVPHPNVLRAAGLDPDAWSGFYVNVGLDRLVMMRYGIDDVRKFHEYDIRFLGQFK